MKTTLTLLAVTTALSAAIGVPAWSAMRTSDHSVLPFAAAFHVVQDAMRPVFVSGDDDDDRENANGSRFESDDDHDDGHQRSDARRDDDDDDCDEGEDDECDSAAHDATPAGTVAPPRNGLFGNGAPPTVKVN